MNLVLQPPDTYLCQAACAAMLAGVDLNYVLQHATLHTAPDGSEKKYLTNRETVRFLLDFNLCLGTIGRFKYERLDTSDGIVINGLEKIPAMLGVRSKRYNQAKHSVVWDPERQLVLDPQESTPQPLTNYEVYEWWGLALIEQDHL